MENNIFITSREVNYLDTHSLAEEINRRMNYQCNIRFRKTVKKNIR